MKVTWPNKTNDAVFGLAVKGQMQIWLSFKYFKTDWKLSEG